MSCSPSARACRTSPRARIRCSRRRGSSISTSTRSTRASGAASSSSPMRRLGPRRAVARVAGVARRSAWQDARATTRPTPGATTSRASPAQRDVALPYDGDVIGAVQRSRADSTDARHRRLRGGHAAGRAAQALAHRACPAAITWNTATRAWATRSPAASASRWRSPTAKSIVMVGDGSYLMLNSEIATSVMLGHEARHRRARQPRLRLHQPAAAGGAAARRSTTCSTIACRARAARRASTSRRMRRRWARCAENVKTIAELEAALERARAADRTYVIVHRDRPGAHDRRRRLVVGSGGAGSLRRAPRCARRATAVRSRMQGQARDAVQTAAHAMNADELRRST